MSDFKLIKPGEFTTTNTSTNVAAYSLAKREKTYDIQLTSTGGRQRKRTKKPGKAQLEASIPQIAPKLASRRSPTKHHGFHLVET
jgi:hypothetical protein